MWPREKRTEGKLQRQWHAPAKWKTKWLHGCWYISRRIKLSHGTRKQKQAKVKGPVRCIYVLGGWLSFSKQYRLQHWINSVNLKCLHSVIFFVFNLQIHFGLVAAIRTAYRCSFLLSSWTHGRMALWGPFCWVGHVISSGLWVVSAECWSHRIL